MVLRDASPGDARVVFERVRQLIAARSWSALPPNVHLTASVGVTVGSGASNSSKLLATRTMRCARPSWPAGTGSAFVELQLARCTVAAD